MADSSEHIGGDGGGGGDYKAEFLSFARELQVLRFGAYTLKSGRVSPYFFNAGLFNSGAALGRLGEYYARSILDSGVPFDMLYGPAYKGIPLATATAIALSRLGRDVPWAFNRKEVKDHGEGGMLVGAPLQGRVLMIDDVISAGTSARESLSVIEAAGASLAGIGIALDRQERGSGKRSAVEQVRQEFGVPVIPIVDLNDLVQWLEGQLKTAAGAQDAVRPGPSGSSRDKDGSPEQLSSQLAAIRDYRSRYGT